jgi:site-specific recombinase XerD
MRSVVDPRREREVRVDDWDQSSTQRFVETLISRGEAPATVARRLATLKHLGRTLAEKVPGYTNPAREVRPPKLEVAKPKALSAHEVDRLQQFLLKEGASAPNFKALRDRVMVMTLLATGLRADEVRTMRRGQVDSKCEWFESVRTKGRRFRNVYIPSSLRPLLRDYLVSRETRLKRYFPDLKVSFDQQLPLFVSTYGADPSNPLSFQVGPKSLWRIVNRLSDKVSLHPHLLRHTFAIGLLNHTGDIRLVSQALGHGDIKVTMRYTERRSEEVAAAVESMGEQGSRRARASSSKPRKGI